MSREVSFHSTTEVLSNALSIMGVFDRFSEKKGDAEVEVYPETQDFGEGLISDNKDDLHRRLGNRQIQLLAIGGSIGKLSYSASGHSRAATLMQLQVPHSSSPSVVRSQKVALPVPSSHTRFTA